MGQIFSWLGGFAGGFYLLAQTWQAVERPVLELVFLGIVPGTDFILNFELSLLILILMLFAILLVSYRHHLQNYKNKLIILKSL